MSSSQAVPAAANTSPVQTNPPPPTTLIDFVSATPPPLTIQLVALAPCFTLVRRFAEIVSWKSHWEESWLLLAAWWSFCLLSEPTLKFFLPIALIFVFGLRHSSSRSDSLVSSPPATETTVCTVIDDLTVIHALLPSTPFPSALPSPLSLTLLRIAAFIYPPYLLLTYLIPLPIAVAVVGSLVLIHRARWARNARAALARSAHLRWAGYHIYALITGSPLPPPITPSPPPGYTSRPVSTASSHPPTDDPSVPRPSPPLRFFFTIYENQRWWMGLDWTAALLPGERPSWCSASQAPLSPPSTFSLPSPTASFVPVGQNGRAKRMARWTWEEPEWRVFVRKEGQDGIWRVEKTPPKDKDGADDAGTAAKMLRAARGRDSVSGGSSESPERDKAAATNHHLSDPSIVPGPEDDVVTDPEGWVYGDNKWEGASSKGGMGKYTRYRRWTRVATLTETVELVGPGDFGVIRDSGAFSTSSGGNTSSMVTAGAASPTTSNFSDWESAGSVPEPQKEQQRESQSGGTRSMLRQRLKAVVDGSGY